MILGDLIELLVGAYIGWPPPTRSALVRMALVESVAGDRCSELRWRTPWRCG